MMLVVTTIHDRFYYVFVSCALSEVDAQSLNHRNLRVYVPDTYVNFGAHTI